ncbi:MAG: DHA1 family tetracycline resistance protein-like MFS transporter [Candidatus Azotimanducaceae bacterium]|jgi:DHA1 family tetracycline resistance protein-like MFS transporter
MNKYALAFIFMTSLMDSIGFGIILPILPSLLMEISGEDLSASVIYGGWLTFVFAFMQFLCAPIIGNLSDRFGRRPVLLLSLFVVGVNYLIMGFALSLVALFIGRMISGAASSTMSTCNAYVADITPVAQRAQNFGLIGAGFGMGFVIGPVIGGLLGEYGPRVPFFAAGIISFLNMGFGFFVLKESLALKDRRKLDLKRANPIGTLLQLKAFPLVIGMMIVMFIYNMGHHVLPSIWSFYGIEKFSWSPREIGYSLGFIGILMVLVQGFLIRWIIPKTGLRWAGIIGMSFTMIAFLGYSFATESWMMYIAMMPGALGALAGPAMQGIATSQVGPNQQGELQGGLSSMMSLTSIISPVVMTQTFGIFTSKAAPIYFPGASFALAAVLTLLAVLLFAKVTVNIKQ